MRAFTPTTTKERGIYKEQKDSKKNQTSVGALAGLEHPKVAWHHLVITTPVSH